MAKRTFYESDVLEGIFFSLEKDQLSFDENIQSKDWILGIAKDGIKEFVECTYVDYEVVTNENPDGTVNVSLKLKKLHTKLSDYMSERADHYIEIYYDYLPDFDCDDEKLSNGLIRKAIKKLIQSNSKEIDGLIVLDLKNG